MYRTREGTNYGWLVGWLVENIENSINYCICICRYIELEKELTIAREKMEALREELKVGKFSLLI